MYVQYYRPAKILQNLSQQIFSSLSRNIISYQQRYSPLYRICPFMKLFDPFSTFWGIGTFHVTVHRKAASWPSNILPSHCKYVCIRLFDIQKCIKAFSKLKGTDLLPTWLTGYSFSSLRRMAFGCFSMLTCFLCQCTYLKLTESSFPICLELGI